MKERGLRRITRRIQHLTAAGLCSAHLVLKRRHVRNEPFLSLLQQAVTEDEADQRDDEDAEIWGQEPDDGPRVVQRQPEGAGANSAVKRRIRAMRAHMVALSEKRVK